VPEGFNSLRVNGKNSDLINHVYAFRIDDFANVVWAEGQQRFRCFRAPRCSVFERRMDASAAAELGASSVFDRRRGDIHGLIFLRRTVGLLLTVRAQFQIELGSCRARDVNDDLATQAPCRAILQQRVGLADAGKR